MTVVLTGGRLTLDEVERVARGGAAVALAPAALERMAETRAVVERIVARGDVVYGLSTGVGVRKLVPTAPDEQDRFNRQLIEDHLIAQGPPAPPDVVRATMLRLANGFARGSAGVRPVLAERLVAALNADERPHVRLLGSVGQADLAPMADLAQAVFADVRLAAKEGLALLNNNAFSTGLAALAVADARRLLQSMAVAGALDLEAFEANLTPLHPAVAEARPYPGLRIAHARLRAALAGSRLWTPGVARNLQDPLSFRNLAGILGAAEDALAHVLRQLAVELNASQENPLLLADEGRAISVANYEALPLAAALDFLRIALAPVLSSAQERLVKLLQGSQTGLTAGLAPPARPQESALSEFVWVGHALSAEARLLAQPVSTEISSASGAEGLEDRITLAPLAARRLSEQVALAERLTAVELVVAAQAVDLRGAAPLGAGTARALAQVRALVPFVGPGDRLAPDLEPVVALVRSGTLGAVEDGAPTADDDGARPRDASGLDAPRR